MLELQQRQHLALLLNCKSDRLRPLLESVPHK